MNRRTYHFHGHVQGVGFRYTVHTIARNRPITGYVRNLPDGSVELVMEGPDIEMDALASAVIQRMEHYIKQTHLTSSPATGEFEDFSIR